MSIYIGTNLVSGSQSPGSPAGGGIPETAIFMESGTWLVPQSVQDEIASEGHAEVGLLMVGGGATAASGEIVNELYPLTVADYNDSSTWADADQPEISVIVGGHGAASGITADMNVNLVTATGSGVFPNSGAGFSIDIPNARLDADNDPYIMSVQMSSITSNLGATGVITNSTYGGTKGTPSFSGNTWSFTEPTPVDGSQLYSILASSPGTVHTNGTAFWSVNAAGTSMSFGDSNSSVSGGSLNIGAVTIIYESADPLPTKTARAGSGDTSVTSTFLNNPTSTEGYFGGFGRFNSSHASSGAGGSSPQGGFVQIFYS